MIASSEKLEPLVRRTGTPSNRLRDITLLDPRTKRDLLGRRLSRDVFRHVFRIGLLIALDAAAVLAAFALAPLVLPARALVSAGAELDLLPLFLVLMLLGQACLRTYAPGRFRKDPERVVLGVLLASAAVLVLDAAHAAWSVALVPFSLVVLQTAVLVGVGRAAVSLALRQSYRRGLGCRRTLVIGEQDEFDAIRDRLASVRQSDIAIVGLLSPTGRRSPSALGSVAQAADVIEAHNVNNVIVSSHLPQEALRDVVRDCFLHGAAISIVPATLGSLSCRLTGGEILGWPLITLSVPRLHLFQMVLKRLTDIVLSLIAIVLLLPVYVGVAIAIKVVMPGPVLFRQKRLGTGGRPFTIYKFRSMRADAEEVLRADPALYSAYRANGYKLPPEADPRIPPFGSFLRKSSLDELPQLFNVLFGDMSLVGPRPIVPAEIQNYGERAAVFLGVRPGVTGHWQISGRSAVGYPERVDLDISYIANWSVWMDLRILWRTIPSVIGRRGAH